MQGTRVVENGTTVQRTVCREQDSREKGALDKGKGNRDTGAVIKMAGNRVQRTWWRDQGAGDSGAGNKGILSTSLLKSMCARA